MEIVVASGNQGKVREIRARLQQFGLVVKSLQDFEPIPEPEEPFDTFCENAVAKARYYAGALGLPVLADDSGLCVAALDGAPGVRSARYAGVPSDDDANNRKLLETMQPWPQKEDRKAWFSCCLAWVESADAPAQTFDGRVYGTIAHGCAGTNGFGYDVLFVPDGHERTFGELDDVVKAGISHRVRALEAFEAWWQKKHD